MFFFLLSLYWRLIQRNLPRVFKIVLWIWNPRYDSNTPLSRCSHKILIILCIPLWSHIFFSNISPCQRYQNLPKMFLYLYIFSGDRSVHLCISSSYHFSNIFVAAILAKLSYAKAELSSYSFLWRFEEWILLLQGITPLRTTPLDTPVSAISFRVNIDSKKPHKKWCSRNKFEVKYFPHVNKNIFSRFLLVVWHQRIYHFVDKGMDLWLILYILYYQTAKLKKLVTERQTILRVGAYLWKKTSIRKVLSPSVMPFLNFSGRTIRGASI